MAIDKKSLQRFLDNPAMFSAADMGLEDGEALAPDESETDITLPAAPEEMLEPELEDSEISPQAPESDELEDEESDIQLAKAEPVKSQDSDAIAKLKRLKAGEPLEDSSTEEDQDVASDMDAPTELRKKALQKIKQKYLGQ